MPETYPPLFGGRSKQITPTPPPSSHEPAEPLQPDTSPGDPLDALLDAETEGERWVRLDAENLLRAADFRRIKQGGHETSEQTINRIRYEAHWPLPSLTINDTLELPRPQWTIQELLAVIGAEVIEPPRTLNQMEWVRGEVIWDPSAD